jgi:hypothetical protein
VVTFILDSPLKSYTCFSSSSFTLLPMRFTYSANIIFSDVISLILIWRTEHAKEFPIIQFNLNTCQSKKMVMTLKNGVFWVVTPCGSCKNRRSGGTSVLTRATRRNNPENTILHSHRRENLKSYMVMTLFVVMIRYFADRWKHALVANVSGSAVTGSHQQ